METSMSEILFLYVTAPDAESADAIAEALVDCGLAACANILPGMRSVYRWEGAVEKNDEVVAIFKTPAAKAEAARREICRLHPYETPCIAAIPIAKTGSNPAFLAWVGAG